LLDKTVAITFSPENDEKDLLYALNGSKIANAVFEFDLELRKKVKYSDEILMNIDDIRALLREKLSENEVLELVLL